MIAYPPLSDEELNALLILLPIFKIVITYSYLGIR